MVRVDGAGQGAKRAEVGPTAGEQTLEGSPGGQRDGDPTPAPTVQALALLSGQLAPHRLGPDTPRLSLAVAWVNICSHLALRPLWTPG